MPRSAGRARSSSERDPRPCHTPGVPMRPGKGLFRASYAVRYRGVAPGIGSLIVSAMVPARRSPKGAKPLRSSLPRCRTPRPCACRHGLRGNWAFPNLTRGKFGLEDTMAVAIKPKSTQHTGLAQSMEGSVAAWLVTFQLDEGDSIHATISIPLTGPPSHHEAQEKALKMLRVFLNDACDAANKFRFSN